MKKSVFTHPILAVITLPVAAMLWKQGGASIIWRITTNWCAFAFSYWTILLFLGLLKIKIPQIAFVLGAIFFAFMGTSTLAVYRPFFSFPTLIHLLEAFIGYGFLTWLYLKK